MSRVDSDRAQWVRQALDMRKKDNRSEPLDDEHAGMLPSGLPGPDSIAESDEMRGLVFGQLAALSKDDREIVLLKFRDGLTFREISEITVTPVSAISYRVHAALKQVSERLRAPGGAWPPAEAVRIEEMINYFDYEYAAPQDRTPLAVHVELAQCPWKREYRLVGYENCALAPQDSNDDTKDAGEVGAAHTVTAIYEWVPAGVTYSGPGVDALKYQESAPTPETLSARTSEETMTGKVRYKEPASDSSARFDVPVVNGGGGYDQSSPDFRWAAAVSAFGMVLRDSQFKGNADLDLVYRIAEEAKGFDPNGKRSEFISLVMTAKTLRGQ